MPHSSLATANEFVEPVTPSSPTKSLSHWWRNFKTATREDDTQPSEPSGQLQIPQLGSRPGFNRSSASSSAVPQAVSNQAAQPDYGTAIPPQYIDSPIFGVPLNVSLRYANIKISLTDNSGEDFVYGHVPVVIAKCALFLKQNARDTEGIFRIPGSVRRVRMLQDLFSTPPLFGKDLDWTNFMVHDAANLLKRYLAMLPEPIIPRSKYEKFREPLQTKFSDISDYMNFHSTSSPSQNTANASASANIDVNATVNASLIANANANTIPIDINNQHDSEPGGPTPPVTPPLKPSDDQIEAAVSIYENLIFALPKSSRQLLLYLIDLLSVFAAQSETNRMPAYNLAAIFQPSVLTIKEHDMNPEESQISRIVIEFLIMNSASLLKRVQEKAIATHELQKENDNVDIDADEGIRDYTPVDDFEGSIPPLMISGPQDSNESSRDYPFIQKHVRRHSKSLSSANPPNLQLQEPSTHTSKLGFLRRQRSTRSNASSSTSRSVSDEVPIPVLNDPSQQHEDASADVASSRQASRSPPVGEEDRKSRFRRSLMVLLPGKDSNNYIPSPSSSRNSSPTRPEMKRSPSWFARLSGNARSPDN